MRALAQRVHNGWSLAFVAAVVVQLVAVYVPRAPSEQGVPHVDKVVHATIFALPVIAGLLARLPALPLLGVLVLHAAVSEELQSALLPERDGSLPDTLADLLGVALGLLIAVGLGWRRERRA